MQEILGVIQDEIDIAVSQERLTSLEARVAALEEFIKTQLMDFGTYLPNVTNE
jgi:hypothetical protein